MIANKLGAELDIHDFVQSTGEDSAGVGFVSPDQAVALTRKILRG